MSDDAGRAAALLALWRAAHEYHRIDACDCNDGFGGCGTIWCLECDVDWPCAGVLHNLGGIDAAGYWQMQEAFFDAAMSEGVPDINEPDQGPNLQGAPDV